MGRATLLALSLMLIGLWSHDGALAQSSATPPVSLAPPNSSPPQANARNARPKREPAAVTNDHRTPAAAPGEPSLPVIGTAPNPAADYDGFNATADDSETPSQVTPPVRSRSARDTNGLDGQSLVDQEDEALKRKLTICKNCK